MREVRIKLVSRDPIIDYQVAKPEDAIVLMQEIIGNMADEFFAAVYLNTKNKPLDFIVAGIGGVDHSAIEPSTVIKGALLQNAPKVMLFHNHPSGDLQPSTADVMATQKFIIAGQLNQIEVLDHIIVSDNSYYSFAENGVMDITDKAYLKALRELKDMTVQEFNEKYSFRTSTYYEDINNQWSMEEI